MLLNTFTVCFYSHLYKYKGIFLCEYEVHIFLILNMSKMLLNAICFEQRTFSLVNLLKVENGNTFLNANVLIIF